MDYIERLLKTCDFISSITINNNDLIYTALKSVLSWTEPDGMYVSCGMEGDNHYFKINYYGSSTGSGSMSFKVPPMVSKVVFADKMSQNTQTYETNGGSFSVSAAYREPVTIYADHISFYYKQPILYFRSDLTLPNGFCSADTFKEIFVDARVRGTIRIQNKIMTGTGVLMLQPPEKTRFVIFKNANNSLVLKLEVDSDGKLRITDPSGIPVNKIAFAMYYTDCFNYNDFYYTDWSATWVDYQNNDKYWYTIPWTDTSNTYQYYPKQTSNGIFPSEYLTYSFRPLYCITDKNDNSVSVMRGLTPFSNQSLLSLQIANQGYHYDYEQSIQYSASATSAPAGSTLNSHAYFNLMSIPTIIGCNLLSSCVGDIRLTKHSNNQSYIEYWLPLYTTDPIDREYNPKPGDIAYDRGDALETIKMFETPFSEDNHIYLYYVPPIELYNIKLLYSTYVSAISSGTWYQAVLDGRFPDIQYQDGKLYRVPVGSSLSNLGIGSLAISGNEVVKENLNYNSTNVDDQLDVMAWAFIDRIITPIDTVYSWYFNPDSLQEWSYYTMTSSDYTKKTKTPTNVYYYSGTYHCFGARWSLNVKNYPKLNLSSIDSYVHCLKNTYYDSSGDYTQSISNTNCPFDDYSFSSQNFIGWRGWNSIDTRDPFHFDEDTAGYNHRGFMTLWKGKTVDAIQNTWSNVTQHGTGGSYVTFIPNFNFDAANEVIRIKKVTLPDAPGRDIDFIQANDVGAWSTIMNMPDAGWLFPASGPLLVNNQYLPQTGSTSGIIKDPNFKLNGVYWQLRFTGGRCTKEGFYVLFYFPSKDNLIETCLPHQWKSPPFAIYKKRLKDPDQ